jgi:hypothetical protein
LDELSKLKLQYIDEIVNLIKKNEKEEILKLRKKIYHLTYSFDEYKNLIADYKVKYNLIKRSLLENFSLLNQIYTYDILFDIRNNFNETLFSKSAYSMEMEVNYCL